MSRVGARRALHREPPLKLQMDLIVTEANESAVALYRKLAFEMVDRMTQPDE